MSAADTYIHNGYLEWPNVIDKLLNHCRDRQSLVGRKRKLENLCLKAATEDRECGGRGDFMR